MQIVKNNPAKQRQFFSPSCMCDLLSLFQKAAAEFIFFNKTCQPKNKIKRQLPCKSLFSFLLQPFPSSTKMEQAQVGRVEKADRKCQLYEWVAFLLTWRMSHETHQVLAPHFAALHIYSEDMHLSAAQGPLPPPHTSAHNEGTEGSRLCPLPFPFEI